MFSLDPPTSEVTRVCNTCRRMLLPRACLCSCADLEVYVLNTEADIQDLTFPHSYDSDSILQISALALQQYSNNGE